MSDSKFTHEVMQPMKVEYDPTLEDRISFIEFLNSFPDDPDEAARLGTLSREEVESICADIYQRMIEEIDNERT